MLLSTHLSSSCPTLTRVFAFVREHSERESAAKVLFLNALGNLVVRVKLYAFNKVTPTIMRFTCTCKRETQNEARDQLFYSLFVSMTSTYVKV